MRYVLDSCVALKWVLRETDSAKAIRIRNEFVAGFHELLAPDIFPVEIAMPSPRRSVAGSSARSTGY